MSEQEKQLLLVDLCARLPYYTYVSISDGKDWYTGLLLGLEVNHDKLCGTITNNLATFEYIPEKVKPYLRPMSSMTEDEKEEYSKAIESLLWTNELDFLNKYHFDYRGLIPKGLALEASEDMYKTHETACDNCEDNQSCSQSEYVKKNCYKL